MVRAWAPSAREALPAGVEPTEGVNTQWGGWNPHLAAATAPGTTRSTVTRRNTLAPPWPLPSRLYPCLPLVKTTKKAGRKNLGRVAPRGAEPGWRSSGNSHERNQVDVHSEWLSWTHHLGPLLSLRGLHGNPKLLGTGREVGSLDRSDLCFLPELHRKSIRHIFQPSYLRRELASEKPHQPIHESSKKFNKCFQSKHTLQRRKSVNP